MSKRLCMRGGLARLFGGAWRSERGAVLIEFAVAMPVLLTLYFAGFTLSDEIARSRKVTIATRALADMAAQSASGTTTTAQINSQLAATTQVMTPYSAAPLNLRITEVYTDLLLNTTVQWSKSFQGTPYAKGAPVAIPTAMKIPGVYLLISEVSYAYTPPVIYGFATARTMSDRIIMLPRNTTSISCGDC